MATVSVRWTEAPSAPARPASRLIGGLPWLVLAVVATAGLGAAREHLDKAHAALVYLLIVLGASSRQGREVGLTIAILSFLSFNFFLLPPYHTFVIHEPLDWLVLGVFLITSAVAAQQLHRAKREAELARQRAEEISRLAALGAETLNAGKAEEAVQAIAGVIRETLDLGSCEIHRRTVDGGFRSVARVVRDGWAGEGTARADALFGYVTENGGVAIERTGGSSHIAAQDGLSLASVLGENPDARVVVYPLRLRDRSVGVLRIADVDALKLSEPQRQFLDALAYYAALGVERVRLVAAEEHAHALREADRLKDALLASVSHDLRTPLTTIKALAHDIRVDGDDRAAIVEEEVDRLDRVVSDLLDLSQLQGGALRVDPELNAADDLVGSALQRSTGISGDHEIRVDLPGDELLVGRFDLALSLRALVNLIENACKYSPPRAPVDLVVGRENGFLSFGVADRGPGVATEDQERIFEPFVRVAVHPEVRGTGLGLSIARRLAEAQGGAVTYRPRPGGGSVFTLLLPSGRIEPEPSA